MNIIQTEHAPMAIGTYSQGVEWKGLFYFSGQLGLDPKTMILKTSFDEQIDQILKNIDALLECQKLQRTHILKTTIFVTDLSNFSKINTAYENFFTAPYPARICIEVSALPSKAMVEVEVIAAR